MDAASSRIQVGWLQADGSTRWEQSRDEAGIALFRCVEALAASVPEVGAFIFCDGPGSILGIRTVAMALRAWRVLRPKPCYAYCSLALVAHAAGKAELSVIADARRDSWHRYRLQDGLKRVSNDQLAGPLAMPADFRHWSPLPPNVETLPYSLAEMLSPLGDADLFRKVEEPDAFLHEEPSYVAWTPQIHRRPTPA